MFLRESTAPQTPVPLRANCWCFRVPLLTFTHFSDFLNSRCWTGASVPGRSRAPESSQKLLARILILPEPSHNTPQSRTISASFQKLSSPIPRVSEDPLRIYPEFSCNPLPPEFSKHVLTCENPSSVFQHPVNSLITSHPSVSLAPALSSGGSRIRPGCCLD